MRFLFYVLLLIATALQAQDQRLFNTTWHLTDLTVNGTNYPPPSNQEVPFVPIEFFPSGSIIFTTFVCGGDACSADGSFIGMNQMNIFALGCFSGGCNAFPNRQFTSVYNDLFQVAHAGNSLFDYTIVTTLNNVSILTITNGLGDIAVYTNAAASVSDASTPHLSLFPNPVSNVLRLDLKNSFEPTSYEVYNIAGQRVMNSMLNSDSINISNLDTGRYFIRFKDDSGLNVSESFVVKR